MPALCLWSPDDRPLGLLGALALGLAAKTALIVDVDPGSTAFPGARTLAEIVADDPTGEELRPRRGGVAVVANGGIGLDEADRVLAAMTAGWPATVLISGSRSMPPPWRDTPRVPLLPLVPPGLRTVVDGPAVYQRTAWPATGPHPGIVLPRPFPGELQGLARHRVPAFGRWLRAWRAVWGYRWG